MNHPSVSDGYENIRKDEDSKPDKEKERLYSLEEIKSCCHDDSAGGGILYLHIDKLLNLKK